MFYLEKVPEKHGHVKLVTLYKKKIRNVLLRTSQGRNSIFYRERSKCSNYLQLLCREIIEFLLYRGFPRPNITSVARDILQAKLVKETRGEVKFLISRKSCCAQFYPQFFNEKSAKLFRFSG